MRLTSYVLTIVLAVAGLFATSATLRANATATATPAPTASSDASVAPATVDTKNFAYLPSEIVVAAGSTVRFTNSDSVAHTVAAVDGSVDSKDMAEGTSWSHVFAKAGTYAYYCAYHRYMKGTVVVK